MKKLINEPDRKLTYDKSKNRLTAQIVSPGPEQYRTLVNQVVSAVKDYKADSLLWDAQNRKGANQDLEQYTVNEVNNAVQYGLKHMAIIKPTNTSDQKVYEKFVADMNNPSISLFDNLQEAEKWLDNPSGQQKKAA